MARQFALARPHDVLAAASDWPLLLDLAEWIRAHPRPGIHPRQIPVAGVHTKVLERNTTLLARLLDALLPADSVDPAAKTFTARFGLAAEPRRVRVRGAATLLGVPYGDVADVEWDVAALAALDPAGSGVTELLVLENKTSYLTVPTAPGRLVLWGAGYGVVDELLGWLPWRHRVVVRYWGDIDTHGFAMLARVRTVAPHTTSVLMDAATLAHRPFWSTERQTAARPAAYPDAGRAGGVRRFVHRCARAGRATRARVHPVRHRRCGAVRRRTGARRGDRTWHVEGSSVVTLRGQQLIG